MRRRTVDFNKVILPLILLLAVACLLTAPKSAKSAPAGASPTTAKKHAQGKPSLPSEPLQRCAARALRGDFGKLAPWQREGYTQALKSHRHVKLWLTQYYPSEGPDSRCTASGVPVSLRVASANLIPRYSFVWTEQPARLRQVLDTGARRNDRIAKRRGCYAWMDEWIPRKCWRGHDTRIGAAVLIPARCNGGE